MKCSILSVFKSLHHHLRETNFLDLFVHQNAKVSFELVDEVDYRPIFTKFSPELLGENFFFLWGDQKRQIMGEGAWGDLHPDIITRMLS